MIQTDKLRSLVQELKVSRCLKHYHPLLADIRREKVKQTGGCRCRPTSSPKHSQPSKTLLHAFIDPGVTLT